MSIAASPVRPRVVLAVATGLLLGLTLTSASATDGDFESGPGMVDRVDALTRLNRQMGVGQAMISHTMSDLQALPNPEDRMKARGFVERAGFVVCGGLPEGEMKDLTTAVGMSQAEQQLLMSWSSPATWDTGGTSAPPARGKFLIKVGSRPGIPVQVQLTEAERAVNDTNKRWAQVDRPAAQVV